MIHVELRLAEDLRTRIEEGVEAGLSVEAGAPRLTSYWEHHVRKARLLRRGDGVVRIEGSSGFTFPGRTYNGVEILNTVDKWWVMRKLARGSSGPARRALTAPMPETLREQKLGVKIGGEVVSYDLLRARYHVYSIIKAAEAKGIALPDSPTIVEIGPGTGVLASVMKVVFPRARILLVDLPQMHALSGAYLAAVFPDARFRFYQEWRRSSPLTDERDDFVFVPHTSIDAIPDASCDLGINTDSFQEMAPTVIESYFTFLRRALRGHRLFYQSNRRSKRMDGVDIQVAAYPYGHADEHLLDGENAFMTRLWVRKTTRVKLPYLSYRRTSHIQRLTSLGGLS